MSVIDDPLNERELETRPKVRRNFNWRWMFTHLLPIFLVLVVGTVITIASVPSFRTSFNKFIAKWSPKADTNSSCDVIGSAPGQDSSNANNITLDISSGSTISYASTYSYLQMYGFGIEDIEAFSINDLESGKTTITGGSDCDDGSNIRISGNNTGLSGSYDANNLITNKITDAVTEEEKSAAGKNFTDNITSLYEQVKSAHPNKDEKIFNQVNLNISRECGWSVTMRDALNGNLTVSTPAHSTGWTYAKATAGGGVAGYKQVYYYRCESTETPTTEQVGTPSVKMYLDKLKTGGDTTVDGQEKNKLHEDTVVYYSDSTSAFTSELTDSAEVYKGDKVKVKLSYTNPNSTAQTIDLKTTIDYPDMYSYGDISDSGKESHTTGASTGTITWSSLSIGANQTKEVSYVLELSSPYTKVTDRDKNSIGVTATATSGSTSKTSDKKTHSILVAANIDYSLDSISKDTKMHPGDSIKYNIQFYNPNSVTMSNFDIVARLPKWAYAQNNSYSVEPYLGNVKADSVSYDATNNIIIWHFGSLSSATSDTYQEGFSFYLKAGDSIPFVENNYQDKEIKYNQLESRIYWRMDWDNLGLNYRISSTDIKKQDIYGKVSGTITGPYDSQQNLVASGGTGKGVPHVYVGLLTKQSDTDSTYKLIPSEKDLLDKGKYTDLAKMYYSQENTSADKTLDGKYEIEVNRATDVTNYESTKDSAGNTTKKFYIKFEVVFRDYKNTDSKDNFQKYNLAIFANPGNSHAIDPIENLSFRTESVEVSKSKTTDQNINILGSSQSPKWEYPTVDSEKYITNQTIMAAEVYTGMRKAKNFLSNDVGLDENKYLPQTNIVFDFPGNHSGYYFTSDNTIHLGDKTQILYSNRVPQVEFHEFGHSLINKVTGGLKEYVVASTSIPDEKIPYLPTYVKNSDGSIKNIGALPHNGYLNDYSYSSLDEGFANFIAVWLDRNTTNNSSWIRKGADGVTKGNLDILYPISPMEGTSKSVQFTSLNDISGEALEENATSEILKEYISGTPWSFTTFGIPWMGGNSLVKEGQILGKNLIIDKPSSEKAAFKNLITTLNTFYPSSGWTLNALYDAIRTIDGNGSRADALFLTHGVFHDRNCNYSYESGEAIGAPASDCGFNWSMSTRDWGKKSTQTLIDAFSISSYLDYLTYQGNLQTKTNPSGYASTTLWTWSDPTSKSSTVGARPWRQFPPDLPGANIKFNFKDTSGNIIETGKVKVDIRFDEPYQAMNYSFDMIATNGEGTYMELPFSIYKTKAVITVEGSSDSIVLDSENYWQAINSGDFNYLLEKQVKVDGSVASTFDQVVSSANKTSESTAKSNLFLSIIGANGQKISTLRGGDTFNIKGSGFVKSSKIKIKINNREIEELPIFGDKFGFKIQVPENIMLGPVKVSLVGDKDESISSGTIWVVANNWLNAKNIGIVLVVLSFILVIVIMIRRTIVNRIRIVKNYA